MQELNYTLWCVGPLHRMVTHSAIAGSDSQRRAVKRRRRTEVPDAECW